MRSFDEYRKIINDHLTDLIGDPGEEASELADAMRYSLEVGGKRLRPALLLAACDFAGGSIEEALPYAFKRPAKLVVQGGLELFVHSCPHAFELAVVVVLDRDEPAFHCGAHEQQRSQKAKLGLVQI